MRLAVVVFAKAPVPGRVKTRLAGTLGDAGAAKLYEQMVGLLLTRLTSGAVPENAAVELHTDMDTDAWSAFGVSRQLQCSGDLGARMLAALQGRLEAGFAQAMITGGDAPTVPASHWAELAEADADVVLGPAEDGGYYAICCRKVAPSMFDGVAWGTPQALKQTEAACKKAGLSVARGPVWFDIDEPSDLARIGYNYGTQTWNEST